jgi:tetratricopeptide (TPR) repeat protein
MCVSWLAPLLRFVSANSILCSLVCFATFSLGADTAPTFSDLQAQSKKAQEAGHYREAARLLNQELAMASHARALNQAVLWNELGSVHEQEHQLAEAERDFNTALNIDKDNDSLDEEQRAAALNNLGTLSLQKGNLPQAEQQVRTALENLDKAGLRNGPTAGLVLANLAVICHKQRKDDAARGLYPEAAGIVANKYGETSDKYIGVVLEMAMFDFDNGDYSHAREKDSQVLTLLDKLPAANARQKALAENNLGLVLCGMSEFAEADRLLTDAVSLLQADEAGPDVMLVQALNSLASVQGHEDKLQAAQQNASKALKLSTSVAGKDSALAATAYNTLGCLELRRNNLSAAREELETALQLWARSKGSESVEYASTLTNLGTVEDHARNHKQAEVRYRAALASYEAQLGPEHPQLATALSNVAAELFARKKFDEALQLYERARKIQEKSLGASSALVASTWHDIGIVDVAAQRFDDAERAYRNSVLIFKNLPPANDGEFASCLREYAVLLRSLSRFSEAEESDVLATRIQVKSAIAAEKTGASSLSFH